MNRKKEIFNKIKNGIRVGSVNLTWGTKLSNLIKLSVSHRRVKNNIEFLFFGEGFDLCGVTLGLYTPFDTIKDNKGQDTLNHLGQNLNTDTLNILVDNLTVELGEPNVKSIGYGLYMRWEDDFTYIEIIPRSHHGSDWNAIIIGTKNYLQQNV